ncbi:hypothetical protein Dimus_026929 [Dionaea muscipula]
MAITCIQQHDMDFLCHHPRRVYGSSAAEADAAFSDTDADAAPSSLSVADAAPSSLSAVAEADSSSSAVAAPSSSSAVAASSISSAGSSRFF